METLDSSTRIGALQAALRHLVLRTPLPTAS
jgi:hypothetical protein